VPDLIHVHDYATLVQNFTSHF